MNFLRDHAYNAQMDESMNLSARFSASFLAATLLPGESGAALFGVRNT